MVFSTFWQLTLTVAIRSVGYSSLVAGAILQGVAAILFISKGTYRVLDLVVPAQSLFLFGIVLLFAAAAAETVTRPLHMGNLAILAYLVAMPAAIRNSHTTPKMCC